MYLNPTRCFYFTVLLCSALVLGSCGSSGHKLTSLEDATTTQVDNLSQSKIFIAYHRNFYPQAVGDDVVRKAGNHWQEGGSEVSLTLFDNNNDGFHHLAGNVSANDKPMPYVGTGTYHQSYASAERMLLDVNPQKGGKISFMLDPSPEVKILTINGHNRYTKIHFNKDLELRLANPAGTEDSYLRISLLTTIQDQPSFQTLGIFKSADTLFIPKDVLKHVGVSSVQNSPLFIEGDNWLLVERLQSQDTIHQNIPLRTLLHAMDAWKIGVAKDTQKPILSTEVTGTIAKDMHYKFIANNALTTKPLSMGKSFALAGFHIHGDIEHPNNGQRFRVFSQEQWQHYIAYMYGNLRKIMAKEYGISFIPLTKVVAAEHYRHLPASTDINTELSIRKNISQGHELAVPYIAPNPDFKRSWADSPHELLMQELNVDGLVFMDIELNAEKAGNHIITPKVTINIVGKGISQVFPMVSFASGTIKAEAGREYTPFILSENSALSYITRSNHILSAISKGMAHMGAQQEQQQYMQVWKLR